MPADLKKLSVTVKQIDTLFQAWLRRHGNRFPYSIVPRSVKSHKPRWPRTGKEYCFAGLTTDLYFSVEPQTLRIHFDLDGIYFDTMHDMEVFPMLDSRGLYTCNRCTERNEKAVYFKTLADLYANHCYEKLLKWARRVLKKSSIIIYAGEFDRSSSIARIAPVNAVYYFNEPYRVKRLIAG